MPTRKEKFSIMRLINTSADSQKKNHSIRQKHVNYILQINKRKKGLVNETNMPIITGNMVDINDISSFGLFSTACSKDTGRPLKQLILSFGNNSQTWNQYQEITEEVISLWPAYQVLAAIHRDIPQRPHCHILIDCYNVQTGLKMSEKRNEFNNLIFNLNKILLKHNQPELLQKEHHGNMPIFKEPKTKAIDKPSGSDIPSFEPEVYVPTTTYYNPEVYVPTTTYCNPVVYAPPATHYTVEDILLAHKFIFPEFYKK